MTLVIGSGEIGQILELLQKQEVQMNALQATVAKLAANVQALSAAVTALQNQVYTAADVANLNDLAGKVQTLTASLTPAPTPAPTPTPAS